MSSPSSTASARSAVLAGAWVAGGIATSLVVGSALAQPGLRTAPIVILAAGIALFSIGTVLREWSLAIWIVGGVLAFPFVRFPAQHAYVTFDRLWLPVLAGAALMATRSARSRETRWVVLAFGLLIGVFFLRAVTTHGGQLSAMSTWLDAVAIPGVGFLAAHRLIRTEAAVTRLAGALTLAGGLLGAIGVLERVAGFELASYSGGSARFDQAIGLVRLSGPYPVPEEYGLALVICLAGTLLCLQLRRAYPIAIAAVALEGAGIALTFFRATWIAALVVVIAAFGLRPRRFRRMVGAAALVACAVLLASSPLSQSQAFEARVSNTTNIQSRFATYRTAIGIWRDSPLFGVGVNRYPSVASTRIIAQSATSAVPYPHSSFIGVLAEQGAVGFLALVAATVAVWRLLRALRRQALQRVDVLLAAAAAGCAAGYLVMSLTLEMLPYGSSNLLFAIVMGAVAARLDEQHAQGRPALRSGNEEWVQA